MNLSSPARSIPWSGHRVADTILREMREQRRRFGTKIKELRKARGWSQEDAAHAVGVGVKTWRLWEGGKTTPYDSSMRKIGAAFGVDPSSLLDAPAVPLGLGPSETDEQLDRIEANQAEILRLLRSLTGPSEDPRGELPEFPDDEDVEPGTQAG